MSDPNSDVKRERPTYSWWVVPVSLFLMVLMSVLVPHLVRKRTIRRLEALGAKVERDHIHPWVIPIDQIPGLGNLSKLPVWMRVNGKSTPLQCAEIYRVSNLLPTLRELELSDSKTTDGHLLVLSPWPWPDLQSLSLSNTLVTNKCLPTISRASRMAYLNLSNTAIDDSGLAEIAKMSRLEHLELTGTKITDAGVMQLKALRNLRVLGVSNTDVSETAIHDLAKELPDLQVTDD